MSAEQKQLLFNVESSGKAFPGTVQYQQNSEEIEGIWLKKTTIF